jgi:hypothetical protein
MDQEAFNRVVMMAGRLFSGVRYFFAKYVRAKMNSSFLDPMYVAFVREGKGREGQEGREKGSI